MRIASAPISWGVCEIPGWGPQLPYPRVLDEMAAAGYQGTELGPWGYLPADPALLGEELGRRGLAMVSAFVPVSLRERNARARDLAQVEATADLLARLGASHLIVADSGDESRRRLAGRPEELKGRGLSAAQWRALADGLHEAAARCAERGLTLSVHSHGGTYVETREEIERLLELTDPDRVGLCLDTGHLAFGGSDPVEVCRRYGSRIAHVHLKDIDLERLAACLARGSDYVAAAQSDVFVELGRGQVDLQAILDLLARAGYGGWLVVEQDRVMREGTDSLASARESREYLRRALAR